MILGTVADVTYDFDYRVCSNCKRAVVGHGFAAALKGLDPKECSDCKTPTLVLTDCPQEVRDDLKKRSKGPRDGPAGGLRAGDNCLACLVKGRLAKLVAMHGSRTVPGIVKPLSQLACPTCKASYPDPDDPVLLEAARKATEE